MHNVHVHPLLLGWKQIGRLGQVVHVCQLLQSQGNFILNGHYIRSAAYKNGFDVLVFHLQKDIYKFTFAGL